MRGKLVRILLCVAVGFALGYLSVVCSGCISEPEHHECKASVYTVDPTTWEVRLCRAEFGDGLCVPPPYSLTEGNTCFPLCNRDGLLCQPGEVYETFDQVCYCRPV